MTGPSSVVCDQSLGVTQRTDPGLGLALRACTGHPAGLVVRATTHGQWCDKGRMLPAPESRQAGPSVLFEERRDGID